MTYPLIKDNLYPKDFDESERTIRNTARAFVIHDHKFLLIHFDCVDRFGERHHYELSGGGVEIGETPVMAIVRELKEELGAEVEVITYLGKIGVEYNPLRRTDLSDIFVCKVIKLGEPVLTEHEIKQGIRRTTLTLEEYYEELHKPLKNTVAELIYARDLYYLEKNLELIRRVINE